MSALMKLVFLAGIVFLSPLLVRADGVVKSDFVFQLTQAVFDTPEFDLASRLRGERPISVPDFYVNVNGAPVLVSGTSGRLVYKMRSATPKVIFGAEQSIVSDEISASLLIRQISVDTVIEQRIGDILARIRVQGVCRNIPLELKPGAGRAFAMVKSGVSPKGLPVVAVSWLKVDLDPGAWSIGDFSCSGFDDFKAMAASGLRSYLDNSQAVTADLKVVIDQMAARLQADLQAWFVRPRVVPTGFAGMNVTLVPRTIRQLTGQGFQLWGELTFLFSNPSFQDVAQMKALPDPGVLPAHAMVLPDGLVQALNDMAFRSGTYVYRKRGQEIAAFKSFMENSFAQSYVWPELSRFPANADFFFDMVTRSKPQIGPLKDSGQGGLTGRAITDVGVLTWAPTAKAGQYEKMTNFITPVNGAFRMTILSTGRLKVSFDDPSLKLSSSWYPDYLKAHPKANTYLNNSKIQSELKNFLMNDGLVFTLGTLDLTTKLKLKASSLAKLPESKGGSLVIQFK